MRMFKLINKTVIVFIVSNKEWQKKTQDLKLLNL